MTVESDAWALLHDEVKAILDTIYDRKRTPSAANPDTSGLTLAQVETEVNELKAMLRTQGLLTP